ncbi:hypothetical protein L7F22_052492, partial [Adiantum nelumboides]|nr:hypothetical protein [Adiantum nelumboides]
QGSSMRRLLGNIYHVDPSAFMCGPPPMVQFACRPNLEKLGYDTRKCFEF